MVMVGALFLSSCGQSGKERAALRLSGIEKLEAGDYSGAVEDFDSAIQASRGRVGSFEIDVLKYRAEAEYLLADYQAAAHTYDVLLEVDGRDISYLYQNAVMKALAGDADGAAAAYDEAVAMEKEEKEGKDGKSAKADGGGNAGDNSTGHAGSFGRTEALQAVGEACQAAGRQDEADRIFQEAVADRAAGPDIFNRMGLSYLENGQYPEALDAFEQAVQSGAGEQWQQDPKMAEAVKEARFNRAVVYEYQGEYQKAFQAFQSYVAEFGMDDEAEKEMTFLQSR